MSALRRSIASAERLALRVWVVLLTSVIVNTTCAQTVDDFGAWFSVNTQGKCNSCSKDSKWRWWFDGHLRYLDDTGGFNQSIFRPGIGYQLTKNANVWLGYGWINTLTLSGAPPIDENRIWQQLLWSRKIAHRKLFSRTRLEQRFVETGDDMGWRLRQFIKLDQPFRKNGRLSFVAWDEAFFDLNSTDWGQQGTFAQNRIFVGLGRKLSGKHSPKIEVGYLHQFINRNNANDRSHHILSTNWFWTF